MSAISVGRHVNPVGLLFVWAIRGYQAFISPALPRRCKYYPSCSQYAIDALSRYGVLRGIVLAGWRLMRCNPMSYGGYDPVESQRLFAPREPRQDHHECRVLESPRGAGNRRRQGSLRGAGM